MEENFTTRVRALCKQRGMTLKELERTLGIANGYIANVSKKGFRPKIERLNLIADYFMVSPEYLLGEAPLSTPEKPAPSSGVMIPLLGRVAAGIPISAVENIIGQEEISRKLASTGEFFALKIKGDSMSPFICDGDVVVVKSQNDAESGEIVIALVNGDDGVCKELKKIDAGIMLISKNPAYTPMVFTHSELDSVPVKILGKVIELRRAL